MFHAQTPVRIKQQEVSVQKENCFEHYAKKSSKDDEVQSGSALGGSIWICRDEL